MTELAKMIHVGRVVRFEGGYGSVDSLGAIVSVHGEPNQEPVPQMFRGVVRMVRQSDCRVDVILFDGRRMSDVHQFGIDRPGIGIKLLDQTLDSVDHLPGLAAEYEAAQHLARIMDRVSFEAAEAARVIERSPLFFYNGIKDAKGAKLQKCHYSIGCIGSNFPAGTISIYASEYKHFSELVWNCFAVKNDTDTQTDYFDQDKIRVIPSHPLYSAVKAAADSQVAKREDRTAKRIG